MAFKSSLDLYFSSLKTHTKAVIDVARGVGGRISLFSWERLGGG